MHIGLWAVLLSFFWLLLSGYIQPLLLSFGVVSVFIVLVVIKRMDKVDDQPSKLGFGHSMAKYVPWLLGQIVLSSVHVTKLIWGNSKKLSPSLSKVSAKNIPENKRVLYANSITLTPGTLSVDLENDEITVHALQADSIEELKQGGMENKIASTWKDADKQQTEGEK